MKLKNVLGMLKGSGKYETAENVAILLIIAGAAMLSAGIGISIMQPRGVAAILAMLGSFISFISTVALIFIWLAKEFFSK